MGNMKNKTNLSSSKLTVPSTNKSINTSGLLEKKT
jgi:hypothetical protein